MSYPSLPGFKISLSLSLSLSLSAWHTLSVSEHMLVLRRCLSDVPSVSSYTVRPYQRIIHTLNHVLTRHNVAVFLPVRLGRCEPQRPVILSETCCQSDEPVCWHRPTHGTISLMWSAAGDLKPFEANLTELVVPQREARCWWVQAS